MFLINKNSWIFYTYGYGWNLTRLPEKCARGVRFDVHHALICKKGSFITKIHNQLRNITAVLLREVFKNVSVEPPLQTITGEELREKTVNVKDESKVDIIAIGFWQTNQMAFFDIRVFYSNAKGYRSRNLDHCYELNEN